MIKFFRTNLVRKSKWMFAISFFFSKFLFLYLSFTTNSFLINTLWKILFSVTIRTFSLTNLDKIWKNILEIRMVRKTYILIDLPKISNILMLLLRIDSTFFLYQSLLPCKDDGSNCIESECIDLKVLWNYQQLKSVSITRSTTHEFSSNAIFIHFRFYHSMYGDYQKFLA